MFLTNQWQQLIPHSSPMVRCHKDAPELWLADAPPLKNSFEPPRHQWSVPSTKRGRVWRGKTGHVLNARFLRGQWDSNIRYFLADNISLYYCSPPARWGLLDFIVRRAAPPSSFFLLPRRTSSASSWSQWSSPDLICQRLIAVVVAGPHLPALDRSGRRRTSSASSWSQWASPDFNRRESERCGPRRTSTGESLSAVGLAGLQPARFGPPWASPDFNRTSTARNKAI